MTPTPTPVRATVRPHVAFGWDVDVGEFAVIRNRPRQISGQILFQAGFHLRAPHIGGWSQRPGTEPHEQIRRAAQAVTQLLTAGVRVANWHQPEQTRAQVLDHYAWLQSTDPFPDAADACAHARHAAGRELRAGLDGDSHAIAAAVRDGQVFVEAVQELGADQWWLASRARCPDSYLIVRYHPGERYFSVTDDFAHGYGPQARRDFRALYQRRTEPPAPPGARATAAGSRAVLSPCAARPSDTPPAHPIGPSTDRPVPHQ